MKWYQIFVLAMFALILAHISSAFAQASDLKFRFEWRNNNSEIWRVSNKSETLFIRGVDSNKPEAFGQAAIFTLTTPSIYACKGQGSRKIYSRGFGPLKVLQLLDQVRKSGAKLDWYESRSNVFGTGLGTAYWYFVPTSQLKTTDYLGRDVIIKSC